MLKRTPPDTVIIDGLDFEVRWSRRRRSIGITVLRDGTVRLAAPWGLKSRMLTDSVRPKLPWIRRKLADYAAMGPPPAPKRLVEGESLPYLGRVHRLVLVEGASSPFALRNGRFELASEFDGEARATVVEWYIRRASLRIEERIAHFAPVLGVAPLSVIVRDLGTRRWGVCQPRTRVLSFHWELILQPPGMIDYVVVHELAHLLAPHHGHEFWRLVAAVLPDWKARRSWLAQHGRRHVL